jgi:hypothetical protein
MILGRFCLIGIIFLLLSPYPGAAAAPQPGVIEGSLSYPSDFIPPDMTIGAENLATKKIYSTNKHVKAKKYQFQVGYKLDVPPGDYHVYAQLPDPARYGAGYPRDRLLKFVTCMGAECLDHTPIVVSRAARPSAASTL